MDGMPRQGWCARGALFVLVGMALGAPALGQEATNTPAATQPSVGKVAVREKVQVLRLEDDPSVEDRVVDKVIATTTVAVGVTPRFSLSFDVPVEYEDVDVRGSGESRRDVGVADMTLMGKYRFWQEDLGPVDSLRAAALFGVEIPSGDESLSSHSFDPLVGGVFTAILGRHGFNQAVRYKFNTGGESDSEFTLNPGDGDADALRHDTAYLFRLIPEQYTAETGAATYLTLELNGLYETNGDWEVLLTPGILYEAREFAAELTFGFPVVQDVEHRAEVQWVVTAGLRVLF